MNSVPPSVQVFAWVCLLVMIALAFGFRLKTKFRADDTIYEGIVADLKRVNERVKTLTEQLDTERQERHQETTLLRTQINDLSSQLTQTKARLSTVQDQVRRMGAEPIA